MDIEAEKERRSAAAQKYLIGICWLVYTIAQIGRYSYSSNTTLIIDKYGISHAEAGLPATFYFLAYGIGQIITGLFCSRYNKRYVISVALIISTLCNLLLFFQIDFVYIKYIWGINGLAQANLWPVLLLTIGQNIDESRKSTAAFWMSTATTGGTFLSYALGSMFAIQKELFYYAFLVSGIMLAFAAVIWFLTTKNIDNKAYIQEKNNDAIEGDNRKQNKISWGTILLFGLFAEFAMMSLAISGGLRQWVPSIMKEIYMLDDAMAIFVTILLPLFSIPNALISDFLYKRFGNFVLTIGGMFAVSVLLLLLLLGVMDVSWILVMFLFVLLTMSMGIIQNQLTVQVPLYMQDKANAGFLAGFLNGSSYIGNALSTYGLGLIADHSGWTGVFMLLTGISLVSSVLALIYLIVHKQKTHVRSKDE